MDTTYVMKEAQMGNFKIIESTSGKVLNDECSGDSLVAKMQALVFSSDAEGQNEKNEIINAILARNDHTGHFVSLADHANNPYADNVYLTVDTKGPFQLFKPDTANTLFLQAPLEYSNVPDQGGALPSINTLVEGLASFYIHQVNAEISDAFFIKLQAVLDSIPELRLLFPNTIAVLGKLEITQYKQALNALQTASQSDIQNLLSNISSLATLKKYQQIISRYPERPSYL